MEKIKRNIQSNNIGENNITLYFSMFQVPYDGSTKISSDTGKTIPGELSLSGEYFEGTNRIVYDWNPQNDAEYYEFQLATDSAFVNIIKTEILLGESKDTFTYNSPGEGEYYARVNACNTGGCTLWSNVVKISVGDAYQETLAPVLSGEVVRGASTQFIRYSWTDPNGSDVHYELEVSDNQGDYWYFNTWDDRKTTFDFMGIEEGVQYAAQVTATKTGMGDVYSNVHTGDLILPLPPIYEVAGQDEEHLYLAITNKNSEKSYRVLGNATASQEIGEGSNYIYSYGEPYIIDFNVGDNRGYTPGKVWDLKARNEVDGVGYSEYGPVVKQRTYLYVETWLTPASGEAIHSIQGSTDTITLTLPSGEDIKTFRTGKWHGFTCRVNGNLVGIDIITYIGSTITMVLNTYFFIADDVKIGFNREEGFLETLTGKVMDNFSNFQIVNQ